MGLDLKYRLASNVTLDATVNPDFGQVELDPSIINLTAFETLFAEQRPFFVEGADIFTLGEGGPSGSVGTGPQVIYSRRIGKQPTGAVPGRAAYSDIPLATTILGAAKVTGRVGDGWSLGVLEAVTAGETAFFTDGNRVADQVVVEPAANYFTGRLRRQIRGGRTRFGMLASAVNRPVSSTVLASRLHASASKPKKRCSPDSVIPSAITIVASANVLPSRTRATTSSPARVSSQPAATS